MPYIPALDSLRAIALLMVMLFHAKAPYITGGFLGVDVFFVLSGFLITTLLRREIATTGRIYLGQFYLRRALRLIPPLLILLAIYLSLAPSLWPLYDRHILDAGLAVAYLSDYSVAFWDSPKFLRHTWSLSVEEHFYLIWPVVLITLRRLSNHNLLAVLIGMYTITTIWRIYCIETQPWAWVYSRFDTRISGMILGAALAVAWQTNHLPRVKIVWPAVVVLCSVSLLAKWKSDFSLQIAMIATEIATAWLIVSIIQCSEQSIWLSSSVMTYVGRLSYGAYLFHFPIMLYIRPNAEWAFTFITGAGLSILLAAASYHSIEAWVRSLKYKRSRRVGSHIDISR